MRIVAFAYACGPGEGSEPGAGWVWSRMLANLGETWVITRANNAPAIEAELPLVPEADRLHFVYVDLPRWARFWKRGQRGVRLYYMLWQVLAVRRVRRLQRERRFDLAWHLTLANVWLGSLAPFTGLPFVYGPVGGGVRVPWRLAPALGVRGTTYELLRAAARAAGRYMNPAARLALQRADLILVQNAETARWLPAAHRHRAAIFPNLVVDKQADLLDASRPLVDRPPTALFAGRLMPLKGVSLAIRAVALLPDWRLLIAGSGFDEQRLRRLARRLHVEGRVEFLGWRPRDDLLRMMREEADVFVFPSLHDESGWVVAEAMSCGLHVVCLDLGGPPATAGLEGLAAPFSGGVGRVASSLAALVPIAARSPRQSARHRASEWTFQARLTILRDLLRRRLGLRFDRGGPPIGALVQRRDNALSESVAGPSSDRREER